MLTKADYFGHWAYFFLFVGMLLLQAKDYRGWAFRFAGEVGWIGIGFVLGLSSVVVWGFAFMAVDVWGYMAWQKEQEELAWVDGANEYLDDIFSEVSPPSGLSTTYSTPSTTVDRMDMWLEGIKQGQNLARDEQKRPRPPAELVNALHDKVHTDKGKTRAAKSIKVKANGKKESVSRTRRTRNKKPAAKAKRNPPVKRKAEGKKISTRNIKTNNRKVRVGRGRRSK